MNARRWISDVDESDNVIERDRTVERRRVDAGGRQRGTFGCTPHWRGRQRSIASRRGSDLVAFVRCRDAGARGFVPMRAQVGTHRRRAVDGGNHQQAGDEQPRARAGYHSPSIARAAAGLAVTVTHVVTFCRGRPAARTRPAGESRCGREAPPADRGSVDVHRRRGPRSGQRGTSGRRRGRSGRTTATIAPAASRRARRRWLQR